MTADQIAHGEILGELARLPNVAHPTVSDGGDVALYYDVTGRNELHVLDPGTGELTQWSDGEVPRDAGRPVEWSADGERVFFHRDEGGDEQFDVYAIDRDGSVEPVLAMDGQAWLFDVGGDATGSTGADEAGETLLVGSTRDGQLNLYRHDPASGETAKLTDHDRAVPVGLLSPDGDRIAYATDESDARGNYDVYVISVERRSPGDRTQSGGVADGSNARKLPVGETGAETMPVDWHPDGDALLLSDDTADFGRCGVYDLDADAVTWVGDLDHEEDPVTFLPGGDRFVATRDRDASTVPVVYDVETGEGRELDVPDGVTEFGGGAVVLDDGRVLLTHTGPTRRTELLAYDLESDEYEALLEAEYGPFSPDDFADAEYLTVRSDGVPETPAHAIDHDPYDELEIGALLYDSGRRPSPLVAFPHGGPPVRDAKAFDRYAQFLALRGYSVLQVNYRGSSGRGREFVERLYDDWGGAEQGDVATGVEYVLEEYDWLDDDRVAVLGGSYGGYSAYWQLLQYPDLYDAGLAWVGVTDLRDMDENTMPHYRTELMERYLGTPEENPDRYEQRSPLTHVENLSAPLVVAHGVNDPRVPVSQARIFRDALEAAGFRIRQGGVTSRDENGDVEYVELGAEGHGSSDIDRKIRTFRLMGDFLERRL